MTPEEVLQRVDENTIGVVPTLGLTITCNTNRWQPSARHSTTCSSATGIDVPVHVDAA